MFGSFPIIPRIYPTPLLFMMKQKWHNILSWKNAVSDALLIIYIVPETTFQYFVFIVLHTCCGSGYKMQLWSMSMWFHSDTSSTLRLEEEREQTLQQVLFPHLNFCNVIEVSAYQKPDVYSQPAYKKGKHPGSRIWTLVGLQQIKSSSWKCWFLLKIWSKRMPVHYIVFPAPQSIISS